MVGVDVHVLRGVLDAVTEELRELGDLQCCHDDARDFVPVADTSLIPCLLADEGARQPIHS